MVRLLVVLFVTFGLNGIFDPTVALAAPTPEELSANSWCDEYYLNKKSSLYILEQTNYGQDGVLQSVLFEKIKKTGAINSKTVNSDTIRWALQGSTLSISAHGQTKNVAINIINRNGQKLLVFYSDGIAKPATAQKVACRSKALPPEQFASTQPNNGIPSVLHRSGITFRL